jgi:hypothetical protein
MTKENFETTEQIFDGKTAGEVLRAARTIGRKKRELQTIARNLCIREDFLEALENGEYHKIPELVYILGFARNYALELELDPDMVVQKIKYELGILQDEADKQDTSACEIPEDIAAVYAPPQKPSALGGIAGFFGRSWKWIASLVLLLGIGAVMTFGPWGKDSDPRVIAPDQPAVEQVADKQAPTFRLPVRDTFGNANRADATVVLQATAETWLRVEDSRGETLFSRVLVAGDIYYVPVAGNPRATVGNAGGLDVWVNGRQAPRLGADHVRKSGIMLTPAALMPE